MEHEVSTLDDAARDIGIGEVAFNELHAADMRQVLPFARHETVDDANAFAAADELFCQVRADEAGAAGYQVQSHNGVDLSKTTAATARTDRCARVRKKKIAVTL